MLGRLISDTGAQRICDGNSLIRSAKETRAMGAGDARLIVGAGNVFEVGFITAVAARFYDCGLIGTAIAGNVGVSRWSPPYPLRATSCRRIGPYRYCDNFEANLGTTLIWVNHFRLPTVIVAHLRCFQNCWRDLKAT